MCICAKKHVLLFLPPFGASVYTWEEYMSFVNNLLYGIAV